MMEKIQGILSDEESMKQVQELYDMLMGETASASGNDGCQNPQAEAQVEGEQCEQEQCSDNEQTCSDESDGGGFDFSLLFKLQDLLNNGAGDKNSELLIALKPHLSEKKQDKVDKAVKVMKLISVFNILKESGLLKDLDKML
ncbi:MAG: hypothetical protein Q4F95_10375 [Oscillospiraceae bacterium]|nr:hypothetical protein [Oscillospiraceae bacterium]